MKQMSTGFGLAVLGACVLGAAFIASPRFGQQAFAQVTGDRRIVNVGVYSDGAGMAYRVWSDGEIETRCIGYVSQNEDLALGLNYWNNNNTRSSWKTVDNGQTVSFQGADIDASGTVDSGDIGNVLLDFGAEQVVNPAPSIECSINQIR